jgi:hypothetical protein
MVLQTVDENNKWIRTTWKCTFDIHWDRILYITKAIISTFDEPEVLAGNPGDGGQKQKIDPFNKPTEQNLLVLQGYSNHFKGRVSISFRTNTKDLVVTIAKNIGLSSDYEVLSKALGQFMDTLELRMYTAK